MRTFLTLFFVVFCIVIQAQSLEECRQLACDHYPEIKKYNLIDASEQYTLSNATRSWLPQVVLSGQATYQSATPTYPEAFKSILTANGMDMSGIRNDQYKLAVDVTQNIWDGGKSKANRAVAEADATEQRSQADVALYDLQSRVDNLFFSILLLDERLSQTNTLIEVLESNLNRMRTYYKNGVVRQADVDLVEAELLCAKQTLGQVTAMRMNYRTMLELFIGKSLLADTLERPQIPEIAARNVERPELSMFAAQKRKLEAQQKALNSSVVPCFYAFAQGYYGYPGLDMFKSMISNDWTFNAIVGVRMNWNIGAFYLKQNNFETLEIAKQKIALQEEVFLFNSHLQIVQQDGEVVRLQKALEDDNRIVELRRSVRLAEESKLANGVIDATDLLKTISKETEAMLNKSTHEIELLQAVYKLKTILNQ